MTTYTVFNIEDDDERDRGGMTLERAVAYLLELDGRTYDFERIDGMLAMTIDPLPWTSKPAALFSGLPDNREAREQILQRFVSGEILMPGPWCIERDDVFGQEMARTGT